MPIWEWCFTYKNEVKCELASLPFIYLYKVDNRIEEFVLWLGKGIQIHITDNKLIFSCFLFVFKLQAKIIPLNSLHKFNVINFITSKYFIIYGMNFHTHLN